MTVGNGMVPSCRHRRSSRLWMSSRRPSSLAHFSLPGDGAKSLRFLTPSLFLLPLTSDLRAPISFFFLRPLTSDL